MYNKSKEEEKKIISEYIHLSNKAKELYKSKKYKEAIILLKQCEEKCYDISSVDKKTECYYYLGLCFFRLFESKTSYQYLLKSKEYLDYVDKSNFPYLKFTGRLDAFITLTLIGFNNKEGCINFINN